MGNQSVTIRINGQQVSVARVFVPNNQPGLMQTATMPARYDGANTITGSGPEASGGGRTLPDLLVAAMTSAPALI